MTRKLEDWVGKDDDTAPPARVKLRVFDRCAGKCQGPCGRKLRPGDAWQTDHIKALINGGKNVEGNLQILCDWCHAEKTKDDVGEKSKTYEMRSKHVGAKKKAGFNNYWRSRA